jgi:integrase
MVTLSILEWATSYLNFSQKRHSPRTFEEKREAFDLLVTRFGKQTEVSSLTVGQALNLLDSVAKKRTGYTANKVRKNLIAGWNWGAKYLDDWSAVQNPFAKVEKYPYEKKPRYVPPMEDVQAILDAMPEPDKTMLLTYLHTGARRSEIFKLKWEDLNFAENKIKLWTKKRKGGMLEPDIIPMTKALRSTLLELRGQSKGAGYVFLKDNGKRFVSRQHWLEYWCGAVGVPRFSFHAIRHLTASWLDAHNVPLTTIQGILRHKSSTTTAKYLHELRGVTVDLDEVFKAKEEGKVLEMKKASGGEPKA